MCNAPETENDAVRSEAETLEDLLSADDADERGDNRRDEDKDEDGADGKLSNNPCSSLPGFGTDVSCSL
jgi:hypothetical protein